MRGVDEVVGQRLVHVVDDVQPLRGNDAVFLSSQIASESLQTDLVCEREREHVNLFLTAVSLSGRTSISSLQRELQVRSEHSRLDNE